MPARRLLIDCDPGVDDALALILAFAGADVRAPAVTTVAGNAPVHISTRNALRVLAIACPQDAPPVHQGAAGPLSGIERDRALHVHGEDGLGNLDPRRYPDPSAGPIPPPAPEAILHWARRLPDEITLVATGPLTNVAAAVRSDPEGMRKLRGIVIMGGAVRVPGNVTPHAEFNIWSDPEALEVLLAEGIPMVLVPLDVTHQVVLTRRHLDRLAGGDPRTRLIHDCTRGYLELHQASRGLDGCFLHDPLALGVALDPSFVQMEELELQVVTGDAEDRGETLEAAPGRSGRPGGRVRVCTAVDAERFIEFFLFRVGG